MSALCNATSSVPERSARGLRPQAPFNGLSDPLSITFTVMFATPLWFAMAVWCLVYGIKGYANQRTDYGLIWTVVGILLLAAATSALIGTWWHQFVLKRRHH